MGAKGCQGRKSRGGNQKGFCEGLKSFLKRKNEGKKTANRDDQINKKVLKKNRDYHREGCRREAELELGESRRTMRKAELLARGLQ